MVTQFEEFAKNLSNLPDLHARFVNTLSLLEYMGTRKILKSQQEESVSQELLTHIAEEIRHAQMLKKVALKMSQGKLNSYRDEHLMCGAEARRYFQAIDHGAAARLEQLGSWTNYLVTTLLIEERANLIYPIYDSILAQVGFPGVMRGIVKEEDRHLQDILIHIVEIHQNRKIGFDSLLDSLREVEKRAFGDLMDAFVKALAQF